MPVRATATPGTERFPERSISRRTAEVEHDHMVRLYRADDGTLLTYEELYDEVDAEGSALPADQWRDGYWDAHEYIVEACLVGIYDSMEVLATLVTRDVEGSPMNVVEYTDDEEEIVAERRVVGELTIDLDAAPVGVGPPAAQAEEVPGDGDGGEDRGEDEIGCPPVVLLDECGGQGCEDGAGQAAGEGQDHQRLDAVGADQRVRAAARPGRNGSSPPRRSGTGCWVARRISRPGCSCHGPDPPLHR